MALQRKEKQYEKNLKDINLTEKECKAIHKSFEQLDINGDGRISKTELKKAAIMLGMNPTDKQVAKMMKECDQNKDGFIDYTEYTKFMKRNFCPIDKEKEMLSEAFKVFDRDGDGFITSQELHDALLYSNSGLTSKEIDDFIKEADKDGNGKIDYDEFVNSTLVTSMF